MLSLILYPARPDEGQPDPTKLEDIVRLFQDPNIVFVGWLHYLVFDLLIGRWIVEDSIDRGASWTFHVVGVVPSLFLTFYLGPTGWLLYMILRSLFLSSEVSIKSKRV